jgi:uncharacterized Zn finger protein
MICSKCPSCNNDIIMLVYRDVLEEQYKCKHCGCMWRERVFEEFERSNGVKVRKEKRNNRRLVL